jgi:hypothetical protein
MGTERIGGFQGMGRRILDRFRTTPSQAEAQEGTKTVATRGETPARVAGDRAEISGKAHEMLKLRETVDAARNALDSEPEVRPDRVAEVKSRLGRGYYQSPTVNGRVADRLENVLTKIDDL